MTCCDRSASVLPFRGGPNPEGELGDLDRFVRQVHAEQVMVQNVVRNRIFQPGQFRPRTFPLLPDRPRLRVMVVERLIGPDQERSRNRKRGRRRSPARKATRQSFQ